MFRLARFSALNITCSKHTYFSESSRIAKSPQLRGLGAKEPRRFCSGKSVRQERLCRSQQCLRLLPHKLFPREISNYVDYRKPCQIVGLSAQFCQENIMFLIPYPDTLRLGAGDFFLCLLL